MKRTRIHLPGVVLGELEREAEARFPLESGGVLLGYPDAEDEDLVWVTVQVGPGPKARHARHRFDPDGPWQAERIAEVYAASGSVVSYLGDWHSHPRSGGKPSALDRRTAREIARCREARAPHPLMAILHGRPGEWRLTGYRRGHRRLRPVQVLASSP